MIDEGMVTDLGKHVGKKFDEIITEFLSFPTLDFIGAREKKKEKLYLLRDARHIAVAYIEGTLLMRRKREAEEQRKSLRDQLEEAAKEQEGASRWILISEKERLEFIDRDTSIERRNEILQNWNERLKNAGLW